MIFVIFNYMVKLNTIYNENCLDTMKKMPDDFVNLVVTSPPYDDLRRYNGYSFDFEPIAKELYRVLKPGGVVVWVVNDSTKDGSESGTSFRQALYFKEIGFNLNDTMIWMKTNPMPQVSQPRYNQCFEYMFIFSKGKPTTFNPIKVPCKCGGQSYNSTAKNMDAETGRHELSYNVNLEKNMDNIWQIAVSQNKTSHPAVFPFELAEKHVLSWSNQNDIVYDPFLGSGTTALAAYKNNRFYIGSEISNEYAEICKSRITDMYNHKEDSLW